ncbi:TetR/AcrR family transcriptional regulator [Companilactobacillus nuruki]|uniref:TetR family transcriptional regulator n=1 Tax=Companilactobacillus nuruki TaxID=1993540 RepID=A0A2N7AS28_9LACO|nr:TetR/AcrR family transcriptional regulator [Companilactobacillus nuruki]PMD68160.1 TetR family transcriptional regulator [Companilactobacillus nuruki]
MSQVTQRTEKSIITAMVSLLQKKPFEKITVGDICDEALINHSTFYRYFNDKYALLHAVFSFLLDDLLNNTSNAKTIVYQIADFMEKNSSFIHHISPQYQTKANLYPEFRSILHDIVQTKSKDPNSQNDPLIKMITESDAPELMISFIVGGLIGLVEYLEDNDFNVSRDKFIEFTENFFAKWSK